MSSHCFSYGSLMFPEVMQAVAAQHALQSLAARLSGWQRYAIRDASYPAARPGQADSSIDGRLWLNLNAVAWQRLDAFEGEAYRRVLVEVRSLEDSGREGRYEAWIYEFLNPGLLLDRDWDPEHFRDQHLRNFFREHGAHLSA
ncbi:MAG: gamma-glutamylcyclotransferase [Betaproteobacteria bacterium]|nr:gamma-glutamylcyclotransferase [Betaproteobacteria bacterium]NBO44235.1 gamma-glutamylcyclotransferase [Betaproteobacteria bacterium]NBP09529.1 gamma-glutamylcyclotransferase [Betaproteobacteria bacterium]NBP60856.1 gamma-glutamylcyclotransferase [Betaproteobacteria bacterium]NBQ08122.1 gamma-glutamylcyclotransferase [Betaproteobacteria bacterium]